MHRRQSLYEAFCLRLRRSFVAFWAFAACPLLLAAPAHAQYPDHPLTLVVPYAPGGGVDAVARVFARSLGDKLKQTVVVENRPGAGAMIGIEYVGRARPDGYTLLFVDPAFVINPSLQQQVAYKVGDFKPIGILTGSPLVLVSARDSRIKSFDDMARIARSESKGVTYATPGVGTTPHMAGELLRQAQGLNLTQVPYKGSGPATADVVSGQVDVGLMSITSAQAFLKENRLQALATTGTARSEVLPNLPTIAELTKSDYSVLFWTGLFVSAKSPADAVKKLDVATQQVYADPAYAKALANLGETPVGDKMTGIDSYIDSEFGKWAALIAKAQIKVRD